MFNRKLKKELAETREMFQQCLNEILPRMEYAEKQCKDLKEFIVLIQDVSKPQHSLIEMKKRLRVLGIF